MEKVSRRKQAVLDVLDEEIAELEEKLQKVQPLIDELNTLRATRARLLDERAMTSGGGRRNAVLSMETVILDLREHGSSTPQEMASRLGIDASIVRSHLNRYRDQRYRQNGNGEWSLIGESDDEDEGDDERVG